MTYKSFFKPNLEIEAPPKAIEIYSSMKNIDILIAHLTTVVIVGLATYLRPLSCASHCNPSGKTNKVEVCMFININHIT
jgi:hypothetical protein